ncbi:MAG TPA: CHAT domain-containing protein [Thermoanaerobaculia bacterium]
MRLTGLVALALAGVALPAGADDLALALGTARTERLAAGESRTCIAELTAGRPYLVAVEQRGIDVVVRVHGPAGEDLATVDSPLERWGWEVVLLHPAAAGSYRIEVRSAKKGVGPGRFEIRLDELPESTPEERERLAGLAAATRGGAGAANLEAALTAYGEARDHFHAAGDRRGEAEAETALAALTRRKGKQRQAADLYRAAAALWRGLAEAEREIRALSDLASTLWEAADLPGADAAVAQALRIAGSGSADPYDAADLRNVQCVVLQAGGDLQRALPCYREALALFRQLGESREEASVLNNLGYAYYVLGEPQPAEESYRQALALRRANGDRAESAQVLNNLAVLFRTVGEAASALGYYGEAREILASLEDHRQEAAALSNLGVAYSALGETERARLYFQQALDLRHAVEDRRGEIFTLDHLGWLERGLGLPHQAIPFYRRALDLARAISDPRAEGLSLSYLGEADAAAGRFETAGRELDRALALLRQVGDRYGQALTLRRQGEALTAQGRGPEALPLFDSALALSRAQGDRVHEAATLLARARDLAAYGAVEAARSDAEAAVAAIDGLRSRLGNPELKASFLGSWHEAGELLVDILLRLDAAHPGTGFDRAALEASERERARTLLDVLRESGASVRGGTPELAARRRDLERRLALKADRRQRLLSAGGGTASAAPAPAPPEVATLEREIEQIQADLDNLDAAIRRQDPRYADLSRPQTASLPEIQALLDPDTLLLEYDLGRERSHLWAVTATTLHTYALPGREEIERAARAFHEAVSRPPSPGEDRSGLGRELGRMLLGPLAARPGGAGDLGERRLAIVADGALHYIPWDVLPEPASTGPPRPLLARHEVVELPSASVLAALRRGGQLDPRPAAPRLAVVLADPVFAASDPRVVHPAGEAKQPRRDEAALPRLRFSRQEAQAIAAIPAPGEVATELDFAADRDFVLSGHLRDYRYVHFATHGVFDTARPELSGLVLSRVDPAGRPREGFLGLRDVYGLELSADLVVLSGCQTALGREIRGEGLLGLTRGFFYAGVPRVIASLWWIDDRATAELMAKLYRAMWSAGLKPAAALREARLALRSERRYRDPYYWGAFVLQGDWR